MPTRHPIMIERRIATVTFWTTLAVMTAADRYLGPDIAGDPRYFTVTTLILVLIVFWWFLTDARLRNVKPSTGLKIAVVALSAIAIPYYRIRHTGWKNGAAFVALVLLGIATVGFIAYTVGENLPGAYVWD